MDDEHDPSAFEREFDFDAYMIDEPLLTRLDELARNTLIRTAEDPLLTSCIATGPADESFRFSSVSELKDHFDRTRIAIQELRIDYRAGQQRVLLSFPEKKLGKGAIRLVAFGKTPDIDFTVEAFARELQHAGAAYHWIIRGLVFHAAPKRLLATALFGLSFLLLFQVLYYAYATKIGVNVDPHLLSPGNEYFKDVERAIKSSSIDEKLDVILRGELQSFENVSEVLTRARGRIVGASLGLVVLSVLSFCLRAFSNCYPRTFFKIGLARERWARLERARDVWLIGVGIAFVVNIVSGLIIAFLL